MAATLVCQENPDRKMPGFNPVRRLQTVCYDLKKSSVKKINGRTLWLEQCSIHHNFQTHTLFAHRGSRGFYRYAVGK